jgi:CHAD domain-containing protein
MRGIREPAAEGGVIKPKAQEGNGALASRPTGAQAELLPDTLPQLKTPLKKQWKRYKQGLKCGQKEFSEETVHDFRIQARRLLAMIELLAPFVSPRVVKSARRTLKGHLDIFDELRDTQVQLAAVGEMLSAFPEARPFRDYLRCREKRFIKRTRKDIRRIKTSRLAELIECCRADLARACDRQPAPKLTGIMLRSVERAFARAKDLRARVRREDPRTVHCTRIAFKRFRYMIETLCQQLPAADEKLLDALHRYQTMMGDVQDAEVLRRGFEKFLRKRKAAPQNVRRLRQEFLRRREWQVCIYLDAADQLLEFWPLNRPPKCLGARSSPSPKITRLRCSPHYS